LSTNNTIVLVLYRRHMWEDIIGQGRWCCQHLCPIASNLVCHLCNYTC